MHVVFVTNKLVNGGGERVLSHLVAGVRTADGRATILFLGKRSAIAPEIRAEMEEAGAQVILPVSLFAILRALVRATTLHLYNVNVYVKALPLLPLFHCVRVICHVHGAAESANSVARRLFRASWNPCDEIVFVSEAGRASWGIARGRVVVNPVTFPKLRARRELARQGQFRLLAVNRLVPVKRVAAQLDILACLRGCHGLDATLDIVGDGPEQAALQTKVATLGLSTAVRFFGAMEHTEVLDLYHGYDAFLATSAAEGLGISLIEALTAGLPAFAAPIPPYCEVADVGGGVIFIDPERPAEAACTIADALATPPLPSADQANLTAAFNAERFLAQMRELYR